MTREQESEAFERVRAEFERWGLLLMTDARLPSVASLVAGEPVRGSWWAHPRTHAIWSALVQLDRHPDSLDTKLVSGKITYVHRKLWPALVAVGSAREPWQMQGLSHAARALLARVRRAGRLRTDLLPGYGRNSKAIGDTARELERRLLVHGEEFHTETGTHAKWLESWEHWARRVGVRRGKMPAARAKKQLEEKVRALNERFGAQAQLPWSR